MLCAHIHYRMAAQTEFASHLSYQRMQAAQYRDWHGALTYTARIHTTGWLHKLNSHPTSATSSYNGTSGLVRVGAGSERLGNSQRDWRRRLCFITEGNCMRAYLQNSYAHSHIYVIFVFDSRSQCDWRQGFITEVVFLKTYILNVRMCIRTYIHTDMHTYIHNTYTHIYINIYIYILVPTTLFQCRRFLLPPLHSDSIS